MSILSLLRTWYYWWYYSELEVKKENIPILFPFSIVCIPHFDINILRNIFYGSLGSETWKFFRATSHNNVFITLSYWRLKKRRHNKVNIDPQFYWWVKPLTNISMFARILWAKQSFTRTFSFCWGGCKYKFPLLDFSFSVCLFDSFIMMLLIDLCFPCMNIHFTHLFICWHFLLCFSIFSKLISCKYMTSLFLTFKYLFVDWSNHTYICIYWF